MSNKKRVWEPLENQSKAELEELKLKTEILKLRDEIAEKHKPWAVKNIAILVPSLIGFLTLLTGYLTGFFNVEAKRLEIQKSLLVRDITDFTAKKDSLNISNIKLAEKNKTLTALEADMKEERDRLTKETAELKTHFDSINTRLKNIEVEKTKLGSDVVSLNKEKERLLKDKGELTKKATVLNENLDKAPFTILWDRFRTDPDYLMIGRALRDTIDKSTIFKAQYLKTLQAAVDTTTDLALKGLVEYMLYTLSNDTKWKTAFLKTGNSICDNLTTHNPPYRSYFRYWYVYGEFAYGFSYNSPEGYAFTRYSADEKIEILQKLISFIKKIPNHSIEILNIFYALRSLTTDYGDNTRLIAELTSQGTFCFLVTIGKSIPPFDNNGIFYYGMDYLENVAPVANACNISNILSNPDISGKISDYYKKDMSSRAQFIIEKNSDVFTPAPASTSQTAWAKWQQDNKSMIDLFNDIPNHCDAEIIKKMIGRK